jgi:hypothetical protein
MKNEYLDSGMKVEFKMLCLMQRVAMQMADMLPAITKNGKNRFPVSV